MWMSDLNLSLRGFNGIDLDADAMVFTLDADRAAVESLADCAQEQGEQPAPVAPWDAFVSESVRLWDREHGR